MRGHSKREKRLNDLKNERGRFLFLLQGRGWGFCDLMIGRTIGRRVHATTGGRGRSAGHDPPVCLNSLGIMQRMKCGEVDCRVAISLLSCSYWAEKRERH